MLSSIFLIGRNFIEISWRRVGERNIIVKKSVAGLERMTTGSAVNALSYRAAQITIDSCKSMQFHFVCGVFTDFQIKSSL